MQRALNLAFDPRYVMQTRNLLLQSSKLSIQGPAFHSSRPFIGRTVVLNPHDPHDQPNPRLIIHRGITSPLNLHPSPTYPNPLLTAPTNSPIHNSKIDSHHHKPRSPPPLPSTLRIVRDLNPHFTLPEN